MKKTHTHTVQSFVYEIKNQDLFAREPSPCSKLSNTYALWYIWVVKKKKKCFSAVRSGLPVPLARRSHRKRFFSRAFNFSAASRLQTEFSPYATRLFFTRRARRRRRWTFRRDLTARVSRAFIFPETSGETIAYRRERETVTPRRAVYISLARDTVRWE